MSNLTSKTDHQLVSLYEDGNDQAFDVLLGRHQEHLFNYIMHLVQDYDQANDIFQDTFVKAIVSIRNHQYQTTGKFSAWLTRIAHNQFVDSLRNTHANNNLDSETSQQIISNNILLSEESCETSYIISSNKEMLGNLIQRLPPMQREIVYLRFFQELSFKEIAAITDVSINTALGRMRYAIINMRKLMNQHQMDIAM